MGGVGHYTDVDPFQLYQSDKCSSGVACLTGSESVFIFILFYFFSIWDFH